VHVAEFLQAIRSVNPAGRWKVLVVDEHAQKLLNSVLKQFDILEENVTCELGFGRWQAELMSIWVSD